LFISRTTTNGLIRYNQKGEFNNSFHVTRNGIKPESLKEILLEWSAKIQNVEFIHNDYKNTKTNKDDFMYLDPPYAGTKGMYYGTIDYNTLWEWLRNCECSYALSFDGTCGEEDRTYEVPTDLYNKHEYIYSGCSSFKRLKKQTTEYVSESLYIR
jgi:DNA adenine methylase